MTGSLQWRPTENSTLTLDALLAKFTNNRDETYLEVISFSRSGQGLPQTDVLSYTAGDNGDMIKGTFNDVDARVEYRHDDLSTEFNQFTLAYDTKFGEAGHLNIVYGQSRSIQDNPVQTTFSFDRYDSDGYSYDYTNEKLPNFNYGFDPTNPANFEYRPTSDRGDASLLRLRPSKAVNTFKTLRADVDYEILEGFKLRYGQLQGVRLQLLGKAPLLPSPGQQLGRHLHRRSRLRSCRPASRWPAVSRLITGFGRRSGPAGRRADLVDRA